MSCFQLGTRKFQLGVQKFQLGVQKFQLGHDIFQLGHQILQLSNRSPKILHYYRTFSQTNDTFRVRVVA